MKTINPSEFKHRIEIQRATSRKNDDDIPCDVWEPLFNPKAKVLNVRGQEFILAKGNGLKLSKTFYIRYRKGIEVVEGDRVLFNGKAYKVSYANDIENRHIYIEIKGESVE